MQLSDELYVFYIWRGAHRASKRALGARVRSAAKHGSANNSKSAPGQKPGGTYQFILCLHNASLRLALRKAARPVDGPHGTRPLLPCSVGLGPAAGRQGAERPLAGHPLTPMNTKICVKCKEEKSVLEFHKNSRSADGLHSYCKECNKAQALAHIRAEKARKALLRAARKAASTSSQ